MQRLTRVSSVLLVVFILALPLQAAAEERIVTLWGDITETMFGLGFGDQIVAVDATSVYPPEVDSLPKLGFPGNFMTSAEAILAYNPTKVIAGSNARPGEILDQLRAVGVEVIQIKGETSYDIDTPAKNIRAVATLLNEKEAGERFVAEVQGKIDEAIARGQKLAEKPRVLFILFSSTRMQFIGGSGSEADVMITSAGGINAAAEVGFSGMTPFSVEGLVAAEPDLIIVTDRGLSVVNGMEGVLNWPGVASTPAGQQGNIISFEDLYFIGMGPRTGDALLELVEAFEEMQ